MSRRPCRRSRRKPPPSLRAEAGRQPADTGDQPLRLQPIDNVTRLVRNPFLVDRIVDARQDAHDLATTQIHPDRRAQRVHHVNRLGLNVLPRTGVERRRLRGQSANRTQIDHVSLQLRTQRSFKIGGDLHILAAADRAKLRNTCHFGYEAHAPRALDAAVHRRLDQRPDIFVFDGAFVLGEARGLRHTPSPDPADHTPHPDRKSDSRADG